MLLLSEILDHPADRSAIDATTTTAAAFADLRTSCKRIIAMAYTAEIAHLDHLIASSAWTDAALALVAIELPRWKLRRLSYDNGEWHCALSSQREMPDWLDSCVEAHHADMAMSVLKALREVMRIAPSSHLTTAVSTSEPSGDFEPMLCDNYA